MICCGKSRRSRVTASSDALARRQAERRDRAAEEIQRLPPQHPIALGASAWASAVASAMERLTTSSSGRRRLASPRIGNRNRRCVGGVAGGVTTSAARWSAAGIGRRDRNVGRRTGHRQTELPGSPGGRGGGGGGGVAVMSVLPVGDVGMLRLSAPNACPRQCQQQQPREDECAQCHGASSSACSTMSLRARNAASALAASCRIGPPHLRSSRDRRRASPARRRSCHRSAATSRGSPSRLR